MLVQLETEQDVPEDCFPAEKLGQGDTVDNTGKNGRHPTGLQRRHKDVVSKVSSLY